MPHWHHSSIIAGTVNQTRIESGQVWETYLSVYEPGEGLGEQLEFALKYDGVNLEILSAVFEKADGKEVAAYVRSKPTGKYARRIWYLYELLTGRRLALEDVVSGNYVELLEPELYYTAEPVAMRRQRVRDNLLGVTAFSPMIRRTAKLAEFEKADLPERCRGILGKYSSDVLKRALSYLYSKETRSSFEIESVRLDGSRVERFVALLHLAEREDFFNRARLIELQNRIVDERYRDRDYRQTQNYVGESIEWQRQRVHFISPRPEDVAGLMEGMMAAHRRMGEAGVHPVVHAAAIAFGFVFLHPFEDGNGRIHRFLIHNILALRKFTPEGVVFPVSAAMLSDKAAYEGVLELFSRPLMGLIEYEMDDEGRLKVGNETARHYRYMDLTAQAEALFDFVQRVIDVDLVDELRFIERYDATKRGIQEVADIPNRLIDLFIRVCLQNQGRMSAAKRDSHFAGLTDNEVGRMERVVRREYDL